MQSTNHRYLSNLDHLRALAAFMVFIWHFTHFPLSCPQSQCESLYHVRLPFFSLLEQGYSGVALFMCISGYIFTYLAYGKHLHIGKFWLNRILRLFPLLLFCGLIETMDAPLSWRILNPQGAWTIYIELQYYLALPFILCAVRKFGPKILVFLLLALIANRALQWSLHGTVQELAYWTIWGHADQFLLGTMAFHLEQRLRRGAHAKRLLTLLGIAGIAAVVALYQYLPFQPKLYAPDAEPSASAIWIFLPSIEGLGYSCLIIAYLQYRLPALLDRALSALGRWSYSIYLDHFQLVPFLYIFAVTRFHMTDDFYTRLAIATFLIFPLFLPFCALTYGLIEKPFLRLRKNYLLP